MNIPHSKIQLNIAEIESLKNRFHFIETEILKTNLAISFQYIIFLISLEEELDLPGPISYSLFKNIIVHTASIIEGTLHHTLNILIKNKEVSQEQIMPKEWVYKNKKVLHELEDGTQICGIHIKQKHIKLKPNTNFIDINRACLRCNFIDKKLFNEIEEIREKRNKIHLAGLSEVDDYYDKKDVQSAFKLANNILKLAEDRLEKII